MTFIHGVVMFLSVVLGVLWMLFITTIILHSKIPDSVINKIPFIKIPLVLLLLIFIVRIWFVAMSDIQDIVNFVFGVFSCNPIKLENFG